MKTLRTIICIIFSPGIILFATGIALYLYFGEKNFITESGVIEEIED